MSFISLTPSKLYKKQKQNIVKFPVGYVGRFYKNLTQNVDSTVCPEFHSCIATDTCIPIYQQKMFKNIFWLLAILEKECKMTSICI